MPHRDPETKRQYERDYRARHRAMLRDYWRAWRGANLLARRAWENEWGKMRRAERKRALWEAFGRRCVYCRLPVALRAATVDHVKPIAQGGPDTVDNRVLACFPCNRDKGDRTPEEWDDTRFWGPLSYWWTRNGTSHEDTETGDASEAAPDVAEGAVPF